VLRILVLPWLLMGLIGAMGIMDSGAIAVVFWFIFGIVIDVAFATMAKDQLLTQFRVRAAARAEETLGILGQLGRWLGRRL
jgi:hypothetical protein